MNYQYSNNKQNYNFMFIGNNQISVLITPLKQLSLPIWGTIRYDSNGSTVSGLSDFLSLDALEYLNKIIKLRSFA
jgi:hypothetical protein